MHFFIFSRPKTRESVGNGQCLALPVSRDPGVDILRGAVICILKVRENFGRSAQETLPRHPPPRVSFAACSENCFLCSGDCLTLLSLSNCVSRLERFGVVDSRDTVQSFSRFFKYSSDLSRNKLSPRSERRRRVSRSRHLDPETRLIPLMSVGSVIRNTHLAPCSTFVSHRSRKSVSFHREDFTSELSFSRGIVASFRSVTKRQRSPTILCCFRGYRQTDREILTTQSRNWIKISLVSFSSFPAALISSTDAIFCLLEDLRFLFSFPFSFLKIFQHTHASFLNFPSPPRLSIKR